MPIAEPTKTALATALDAHAETLRTDAALTEQDARNADLAAQHQHAAQDVADADAALALATGDAAAKTAEARVRSALKTENETRVALERGRRISAALRDRLTVAEQALEVEVGIARQAVLDHAGDVTAQVHAEISEACKPLVAAIRRAVVLAQAAGASSLAVALQDVRVPNVCRPFAPLLEGIRVAAAAGRVASASENWQADPALVALHAEAKEPRDVLATLTSYKPRAQRDAAAKPAIWKGRGDAGGVTNPALAQPVTA